MHSFNNTINSTAMRLFLILILISFPVISFSQVGVGTTSVHQSAKLQVDATNKGFLPPRMTSTERDLIATPAAGLVIFNTTSSGLEIYTSGGWVKLASAGTNSDITALNGLTSQKIISVIAGPINTSSYSLGDIVYDQSSGKYYFFRTAPSSESSPSFNAPTSYFAIFDAGRIVMRIRPTKTARISSITLNLGTSISNAVLSMYSELSACASSSITNCINPNNIATVNTNTLMGSSASTTSTSGNVTFTFSSAISVTANVDYYLTFSSNCVAGSNIGVFSNQSNSNFELSYGTCTINQGIPAVRINYANFTVID